VVRYRPRDTAEGAMSAVLSAWLQFAICAALIGAAGYRLSLYGDVIAEKTGLGRNWVGLVMLASVTSLPELVTGVSAVTVAKVPNIAIGDVLGSCVFNLLLVVLLDFLHRGESVYTRAGRGHILSAGFGTLLIGLVAFNLMLGARAPLPSVGHVGVYSAVIVLLYGFAMRTIFVYERRELAEATEQAAERYPGMTLRHAATGYTLASLVVVAAGIWLPFIGAQLAQAMGWHKTFVGTLFVAFATSVPEVAVTLSALRLGALDMAIGNLLGSNLFDIVIVAIDDLFFLEGPILAHVSPLHVVSAVSAMMMNGVAIVGLLYRSPTRILRTVGWVSLFLLVIYLFNSYVLFLHGE
jgi:cation:H+ antiporter